MRISDAIRQLQTTNSTVSLREQFLFIETDDFPADERLRFHAFEGEKFFLQSIISDPYERALKSIHRLDEDLDICREEIVKFQKAYFNPPHISMLDDQRKVRIPLVNIFRYYALWLCIADHQKPSIVSRERVEDDFRVRIDTAFKRYESLIDWLTKRVKHDERLADSAVLIADLITLRRVADIPPSSLREEQAQSVVKFLGRARETEQGMNNRMLRAKRQAVNRFGEALLSGTATSDLVGEELPVRWQLGEAFETTDWTLDSEFSRLARCAVSMSSIMATATSASWHVPQSPRADQALNVSESGAVFRALGKLRLVDIENVISWVKSHVYLRGEDIDYAHQMIEQMESKLKASPFANVSIQTLTLVQLFLVHYGVGLQTGKVREVAEHFSAMCEKLTEELYEFVSLTVQDWRGLDALLSRAWPTWIRPVGFMYYFWADLGNPISDGSIERSKEAVVSRYGANAERFASIAVRCRLHDLFHECGLFLDGLIGGSVFTKKLESLGMVVTANNVLVKSEPRESEPNIGVNMSKGWLRHDSKYRALKEDDEKWSNAMRSVEGKAREICDRVLGLESDTEKRIYLPDEIKGKRGDIKSVMAARWTLFVVEKYEPDIDRRTFLFGWLRSLKATKSEKKQAWNAYRIYFFERGVMFPANGISQPHSFTWHEERIWVDRYRPPRTKH